MSKLSRISPFLIGFGLISVASSSHEWYRFMGALIASIGIIGLNNT